MIPNPSLRSAAAAAFVGPVNPRRSRGWWLGLLVLLSALGLLPGRAHATHIVGGQLGMTYVSPGVYDLTFTLYFDAINGSANAFDSTATVVTFERGRGRAGTLDTIALLFISRTPVSYTNPGCQNSTVETDEIRYARRVFLDPARYASPRGYYVAWQRRARNNGIVNIDDPLDDTGQTFYLEFPALRTLAGANFINSSPTNFRPLRDYACIGRPFRYPFGGTDPDGDSLIYELVSPLQYTCDSLQLADCIRPTPGPAPYPPVSWAAGYDSTRQITGLVPLRINRFTGELSFTANQPGLHVFAVRVREYRRGRLLGELRREFQEMIVACTLNQVPSLSLTPPGPPRTGPILANGQLVTLPPAGEPGERCLNVYATDPDGITRLRLRVVPIDSLPARPAFSITNGVVNTTGRRDSLYSRLCFDQCFSTNNNPLRFWVIAEDEGCPQPQPDTVLLLVRAAGGPGGLTTLSLTPPQATYTVPAGTTLNFAVTGFNADGQSVTVRALSLNGGPLNAEPTLLVVPATGAGSATALITWPTICTTPPGTYLLRLRGTTPGAICTTAGATDTTVRVTVLPNEGTFDAAAPNIITPNGDDLNDRFAPRLSRSGSPTDCFASGFRQLRIFNRWGKEIFQTTDEQVGWNGTGAGAGTYYYLLEYTERPNVKGWVELVR